MLNIKRLKIYVICLVTLLVTLFDGCKKDQITSTGNGIIFNPDLSYGSMTDQQGNVYKTITIGTQTWMAENLKTTIYRNGEHIYKESRDLAWGAKDYSAYCWYNNDSVTNMNTNGA